MLRMIEQRDDLVFFTSTEPLRVGHLLQVSQTDLAIVIDHRNGVYTARLQRPTAKAAFVDVSGSWTPDLRPRVLVPDIFFHRKDPNHRAILQVRCLSPEQRPGRIEWKLYFRFGLEDRYIPIVAGCDYTSPRECFFSRQGSWQRGYYRLVAQRFSQPGRFFIKEASTDWVLTARTQQLVLDPAGATEYLDLTA